MDKHAQMDAPDIETASEDYARRFAGKVGDYFLKVQSSTVLKLLGPGPGLTVLDVGGGHAQLAVPLVGSGFEVTVTGSDAICRRRLDGRLSPGSFHFQVSGLLRLPFLDESFDVVMAFRLLTHLEEWQTLLSEMCRVSKQTILLDYPDVRSANFFSNSLFRTKKAIEGNTRPFRLFARRQVLDVLEGYGFGQTVLRPQFFIPMVVHRMLGSLAFTKCVETICRLLGLTRFFGSPVILKATRLKARRA
jgi:hypothetical protein